MVPNLLEGKGWGPPRVVKERGWGSLKDSVYKGRESAYDVVTGPFGSSTVKRRVGTRSGTRTTTRTLIFHSKSSSTSRPGVYESGYRSSLHNNTYGVGMVVDPTLYEGRGRVLRVEERKGSSPVSTVGGTPRRPWAPFEVRPRHGDVRGPTVSSLPHHGQERPPHGRGPQESTPSVSRSPVRMQRVSGPTPGRRPPLPMGRPSPTTAHTDVPPTPVPRGLKRVSERLV